MSETELAEMPEVLVEPSVQERKEALQSAIYYLMEQQPFYGSMLQQLTIKYDRSIPTAAITFNQKSEQFEIYLGNMFFPNLSQEQRVAVLHHEILHFTNNHLFRLPMLGVSKEDAKTRNIAGDMSINQYIPNLPDGCVDYKDWKYKEKGQELPFPKLQTLERYYELLTKNKELNKEQLEKYKGFDQHDWDGLDEETKRKMLEEAKKLIKRTIEKSQFSHTSVPGAVKDLLEELEKLTASMDYKGILKRAIKRTVSAADRENTWKRSNKRYGTIAPGSKLGALPKLAMYLDTSGSISHTELNNFLSIVSEFLKVGARTCSLILWHTEVYLTRKYKLSSKVEANEIEHGGTDMSCVLTDIKKTNPNLAIVLTDGYYDASTVKPGAEIIFIISKGGNQDHPLKHLGKTILLDNLA